MTGTFHPARNEKPLRRITSEGATVSYLICPSQALDLDYNSREDLTFIFVDDDCDCEKRKKVETLKTKMSKDTVIVKSSPIFELWFLNHFCKTTKEYFTNTELIANVFI